MASSNIQTIYQPLHPSLLHLLDPEYITFHNSYLQQLPPSESGPWDPKVRKEAQLNPFATTATKAVDVKSIRDINLEHSQLRVFTPEGERPVNGWPVLLWFHGGA